MSGDHKPASRVKNHLRSAKKSSVPSGLARASVAVAFAFVLFLSWGWGSRLTVPLTAQTAVPAPEELPGTATAQLMRSLAAARSHERHVWRDTPAENSDGTVNAFVEIARGDRRKWELDMAANARAVDRTLPAEIGGYPINYGFIPQTISYDGDPFDALVAGPPIAGGTTLKGAIIGFMQMTDEKGLDSKVVLSPVGRDGKPLYQLTAEDQERIAQYFRGYKRLDPKTFSTVPGWGSAADGLAYVTTTHAFFRECRDRPGQPCRVARR